MTFLFDIGKVLLDFDFKASLKSFLPPDHASALSELLTKKDEFEAGRISVSDYLNFRSKQ